MIPFAYLSPGLGYLLWGGASLAVLVLAVWLLARALIPRGDRLTFALLVASSLPAGRNLYLGQTSFLLLMKPQLFPVWLLTLLWYRRFRALALFFLGASTLLLISTVLVGVDGMNGYVGALLLAGGSDRVGFQAIGSHTLAGLAYTVGTEASSGLSIWLYPV